MLFLKPLGCVSLSTTFQWYKSNKPPSGLVTHNLLNSYGGNLSVTQRTLQASVRNESTTGIHTICCEQWAIGILIPRYNTQALAVISPSKRQWATSFHF